MYIFTDSLIQSYKAQRNLVLKSWLLLVAAAAGRPRAQILDARPTGVGSPNSALRYDLVRHVCVLVGSLALAMAATVWSAWSVQVILGDGRVSLFSKQP